MELKDAFNVPVTLGDQVTWRTRKGFRRGKIEKIYMRTHWRKGPIVTFIMRPTIGYAPPVRVKVFHKS